MIPIEDRTELEKFLRGELSGERADDFAAKYLPTESFEALSSSIIADETFIDAMKQAQIAADVVDPTPAQQLLLQINQVVHESELTIGLPPREENTDDDDESEPEVMPERLEYFEIQRVLGRGGMGTVYLAHDTRLDREVAIKTMRRELATSDVAKERFFREAQAAATLEHVHIAPVFYIGESAGIPFLAMPFLKGGPLDRVLLKYHGTMPYHEMIRIGREIALGLAVAHQRGLVHRDIKPANIWIESPRGRVKILDFGLARLQSDDANLTTDGVIMGTPAYMAPEQARGLAIDGRADLFSLGVILYEMATGRKPFKGTDVMSILTSIAIDDPTPVAMINHDVHPNYSKLVAKLLSKTPQGRPATAQAVAEALLNLKSLDRIPVNEALPDQSGQHVTLTWVSLDDNTAPTQSAMVPALPASSNVRTRRRRWWPIITLTSVFVMVIVVVMMVWQPTREDGKNAFNHQLNAEPKSPVHPSIEIYQRERQAITFVIEQGGQAGIGLRDMDKMIRSANELINEPFTLRKALFQNSSSIQDDGLAQLINLVELERLNLANTAITDVGMEQIGKITTLQQLNLSSTKISNQGAQALRNLSELQQLNLARTAVSDEGLSTLSGLSHLMSLDLSATSITEAGLKPLAKMQAIKELRLEGTKVGDDSIASLSQLTNLRLLDVRGTMLSPEAIAKLKASLNFCEIVTDTGILPATEDRERLAAEKLLRVGKFITVTQDEQILQIKEIANLPKNYFCVHQVNFWDIKELESDAVEPVADLQELNEILFGYSTMIDNQALDYLKDHRHLRWLNIITTNVSDAGLEKIVGLQDLRTLQLFQTQVTDAGLVHVNKLKKLTTLGLGATKITNAGLQHLIDLDLQDISFSGTAVTDEGLEHLLHMKKLTLIDLNATRVTQQGVDRFRERMPQCSITWNGKTIPRTLQFEPLPKLQR